jgi:hypothetical protein
MNVAGRGEEEQEEKFIMATQKVSTKVLVQRCV